MNQKIKKQIDYLIKITDKTGVIEHCSFDQPNYSEGYSVDDNARALQICLRFKDKYPELNNIFPIYFNFLKSALKDNAFYNDLDSDLKWKSNFEISGEHYGRSLAALGEIIEIESAFSQAAIDVFDQIYNLFSEKKSSHHRVSAQIILGLKYYRSKEINIWSDLLVNQYLKEKTDNWKWFETTLSYDIGRLPLALLTAYKITNNSQYLEIALESLDFLTKKTFSKRFDCFVFPGNKGWFTKLGCHVIFDQQPIEAGSITEIYSLAFQITKDNKYRDLALKSFAWYSGDNILKANMVDSKTGGIYDGFNKKEINHNQGSESVLSYLFAYDAVQHCF
jgi:hypothetical protein